MAAACAGLSVPARSIRDLAGINIPVNREIFDFRSDSDLAQLAVMRAEWRKDTRWLWLLPPATVLWTNIQSAIAGGE